MTTLLFPLSRAYSSPRLLSMKMSFRLENGWPLTAAFMLKRYLMRKSPRSADREGSGKTARNRIIRATIFLIRLRHAGQGRHNITIPQDRGQRKEGSLSGLLFCKADPPFSGGCPLALRPCPEGSVFIFSVGQPFRAAFLQGRSLALRPCRFYVFT